MMGIIANMIYVRYVTKYMVDQKCSDSLFSLNCTWLSFTLFMGGSSKKNGRGEKGGGGVVDLKK